MMPWTPELLDQPEKPDKGQEGGSCNRRACQDPGAIWFNHGSHAWYCDRCRRDIEFDSFNKRNWDQKWLPRVGHPMFETREMMEARKESKMSEEYENVTVKLDPRRQLVNDLLSVIFEEEYGYAPEQAIADVIMAACIVGELFDIKDEEQYLTIIRAAIPNARKAAAHLARKTDDRFDKSN